MYSRKGQGAVSFKKREAKDDLGNNHKRTQCKYLMMVHLYSKGNCPSLYTMSSAQLNVCLRFNSVFISFKTGISSADISYHQHFCISLDFYFVALSQCCFLLFYLMVSECFCHRCLKAAFPEKHWLLAWAHKVTESRLKARHPASILHLGPLLWAILSCSHFAAILKPRKNLTTCQVSMTLIVTRPHLTNPETMSC
jgi:hypothetical protein